MFNTLFNLKVLRAIPQETIGGLFSGQYTIHGGVIRWATGTEQAGRIVRHLIPLAFSAQTLLPLSPLSVLSGPISVYQLAQLRDVPRMTKQILQLATSTMVLSGLNLAVSGIGFGYLAYRLRAVEARLEAIQSDVKAIRVWLEGKERAVLRAALHDLCNTARIEHLATRQAVLIDARRTFGELVEQYRELLTQATEVEPAMLVEEYYCLTMLARARCSAELGEGALAHHEFATDSAVWTEHARRIAKDVLIGKHPERFLYRDTAKTSSVTMIIDWLNFAYDDPQGYAWIDTLRLQMSRWHDDESTGVGLSWGSSKRKERVYERETVVPSLARLTARHYALEGHLAQFAMLSDLNVTPSVFERQIEKLASSAVEGYLIV